MDVQLIEKLNVLWQPIYPYLARWVDQLFSMKEGVLLELGPFSGGISDAMINLFPDIRAVCLMQEKEK